MCRGAIKAAKRWSTRARCALLDVAASLPPVLDALADDGQAPIPTLLEHRRLGRSTLTVAAVGRDQAIVRQVQIRIGKRPGLDQLRLGNAAGAPFVFPAHLDHRERLASVQPLSNFAHRKNGASLNR